jgi:hypothetical protein
MMGRLVLTLVMTLLGLPPLGAPVEASLHDSHNEPIQLSRYRGKPTVLIYEDRQSKDQNHAFKHELWLRGKALQLLGSTHVVAVVDLRPYDFFFVRGLALRRLREVEQEHAIPVLADWKGELSAPPWGLPRSTSSVVVLDDAGRALYVHSGTLASEDMEHVFLLLGRLLGVNEAQAPSHP